LRHSVDGPLCPKAHVAILIRGPAAGHGLQIADARGPQRWQLAGKDRSGIQEPCCVDTCTPQRTTGPEPNPVSDIRAV